MKDQTKRRVFGHPINSASIQQRKKTLDALNTQHVAGHMDKYLLLWHQLSLIQQLNCVCNTIAKAAVHRAITTLHQHPNPDFTPRRHLHSHLRE